MSDAAFPSAPYAGYTTRELETFVSGGRLEPKVIRGVETELARRVKVREGDVSVMTAGERLRHATNACNAQRIA